MKPLDDNLRYLCDAFPDMARRLVLQAKENEIQGDVGAVEIVAELMSRLRRDIQWWVSDSSRELRRRLREAQRRKGERGG